MTISNTMEILSNIFVHLERFLGAFQNIRDQLVPIERF